MSPARPHLFVGIPSKGGKLTVELHRYLEALAVCAATGQIPYTMNDAEVTGLSPVHYARNVLCRIALSTQAERILMIDDDMLPTGTTSRILRSGADICVSRMYRFRHNGENALTPEEKRPPEIAACATYVRGAGESEERFDIVPEFDAEGTVELDAAGTGCIMIHRRVLDDPRMRCGESDPDGTPAFFRMPHSDTGRILEWEDVDFTLRAKRLGYSVIADFGSRCGHMKAVNLDAVAELVHNERKAERAKAEAEFAERLRAMTGESGAIWLPGSRGGPVAAHLTGGR